MLLLARRKGTELQSTIELSSELNISESYLQQLTRQLLVHELIKSRRGPYGGYSLNKSAEYISLGDVIRAMLNHKTVSVRSHSRESILWGVLFNGLLDYLDTFPIKYFATIKKEKLNQDLTRRSNYYFMSKLLI